MHPARDGFQALDGSRFWCGLVDANMIDACLPPFQT
jgi:hypothetical protein